MGPLHSTLLGPTLTGENTICSKRNCVGVYSPLVSHARKEMDSRGGSKARLILTAFISDTFYRCGGSQESYRIRQHSKGDEKSG